MSSRGRWEGHVNSRFCICATCGRDFDQGYAVNARRAAKPKYCSKECFAVERVKRANEQIEKRLWSRIDKRGPDECWPWTGRRNARGYGEIDIGHRPHVASRVVYQIVTGTNAMQVCHRCDNPPCCNPSHLFGGTAADNVADMISKGRQRHGAPLRGMASGTSKLTDQEVLTIFGSPEPNPVLAARYNVSDNAIRLIKIGVNWRWLTRGTNAA